MIRNKQELEALRLVAHSITPNWKVDEDILNDEDILKEAVNIALKNKVFIAFYEGLKEVKDDIPNYIEENAKHQLKRLNAYTKAFREFTEIAEDNNIKFMIIKSAKPFTYVGDDIDILSPSINEFNRLVSILKNHGYYFLGSGPPEATFLKRVDGVNFYLDIHRKLSASQVPYVDAGRAWNSRRKGELYGCSTYVPSFEYDILIVAGHSVMKEFRINLADFLHVILSIHHLNLDRLYEEAEIENLRLALDIFMSVVKKFSTLIYNNSLWDIKLSEGSLLTPIAEAILRKHLIKNFRMPYFYHVALPAMAYAEKLYSGLASGEDMFQLLSNFLKAPFTNIYGIKVLINYLRQAVL